MLLKTSAIIGQIMDMFQEKQANLDGIKTTVCVVRVVVPVSIPKVLDYAWKSKAAAKIGTFVKVPIGNRETHGLIIKVADQSQFSKLKEAVPLDVPLAHETSVKFWRWIGKYTLSAPGDALRAVLVSSKVPDRPEPITKLKATGKLPERETKTRAKVLKAAGSHLWQAGELAQEAGVSAGVVQGLTKEGCLEWVPISDDELYQPCLDTSSLSAAQATASAEMKAALTTKDFKPFLLDGVMGSGKTEVYFDAIAHMLETEPTGQALVLVPEIALTPQWMARFKKRFGFEPVVWHSAISERARKQGWHAINDGNARVIVGARSALLLPYQDLRFIVVDEEHDASYKQEEQFRYNGRDMAVVAANMWKCPIVLASATPSLETWHNVQIGRYGYLTLPDRFGGAVMPSLNLVDMRQNPPPEKGKWLSTVLIDALDARLGRKEQSLIFLNRRGYAPLLLCRGCGHRHDCPSCDASMIVHGNRLQCHHCGFSEPMPDKCSNCESDKLFPIGPGTRRVVEEINDMFPNARIGIADSDAVSGVNQMAELVQQVEDGEVDIVVGTQMVAKGHNFPNLTMVGIVDADMGLAHGDLRTSERTFQLLTQVSGRAGRYDKKGEVYIQTYQPEHPLFQAILDSNRDGFYRVELDNRKMFGDPPFGRWVSILLSGKFENQVISCGQLLVQNVPQEEGVQVLGPAAAPLARLKDRFRYRILIKGNKPLQGFVKDWLEQVPVPQNIRIDVDVDPQRFA